MPHWRSVWTAFLLDVATHPAWYALAAYLAGMAGVSLIRERERVRTMLVDLERDMTERQSAIFDRMVPAVEQEYDAVTTITDDDVTTITRGAIHG